MQKVKAYLEQAVHARGPPPVDSVVDLVVAAVEGVHHIHVPDGEQLLFLPADSGSADSASPAPSSCFLSAVPPRRPRSSCGSSSSSRQTACSSQTPCCCPCRLSRLPCWVGTRGCSYQRRLPAAAAALLMVVVSRGTAAVLAPPARVAQAVAVQHFLWDKKG